MCKESEQKSVSKTELPDFVEAGGRKLVDLGVKATEKPFEAYTGDRVADLNDDQLTAFQKIRNLVSGAPQVLDEALAGARNYAAAPAQNISTERIVDENGKLGAVSDYLNPYVESALQPALRKIMEAADQQRKRIGANATSAGAFGDARHGIVESELDQNTSTAIGDTSSQFLKNAFDTVMANRSADLNRFFQADTANANYNEDALGRELTGTGAIIDRMKADGDQQLQQIQALLAGGTAQQANTQAGLDADFGEFLRKQGYDASLVDVLARALGAAPYEKSQTTTTTSPDNSGLGVLGSIAGSIASAFI